MYDLDIAIRLARGRDMIRRTGKTNISRMCAILSDGHTAFVGFNSRKTHPIMQHFSNSPHKIQIHAEMDAIRQAVIYYSKLGGFRRDDYDRVDLSGYSISVARVLADGSPALACPCPEVCMPALEYFGIKAIEYSK